MDKYLNQNKSKALTENIFNSDWLVFEVIGFLMPEKNNSIHKCTTKIVGNVILK